MSLRVNNNIQSMNAHRNLVRNDNMIGKSLERLSSGMKINRGADGAAGLIISEQQRAQIAGINQAIANSTDGVSMVQTAEGGLDEMSTLLNKARSLALHSANEGANDVSQLQADQTELDNITSSIDRIASNTQFGNKKILDGSLTNFRSNSAQVGSTQTGNDYAEKLKLSTVSRGYHSLLVTTAATKGSMTISGGEASVMTGVTLAVMSGSDQFQVTFTVAVNGNQLTIASGQTKNDFVNALNALGRTLGFSAAATSGVGGGGQTTGGTGNIVLANSAYGASSTLVFNYVSGPSGVTTVDGAYTAGADMAASLILNTGAVGAVAGTGGTAITLVQSGNSLALVSSTAGQGYRINLNSALSISGGSGGSGVYLGVIDGMSTGATFQVGANVGQTASVTINSAKAGDLGNGVSTAIKSLSELGGQLVAGNATEVLKVIDKAITDVAVTRGNIGAFQANTLETTISSLRVAGENLTAAESAVRDVDFAEESARFTKYNILMQSATAMMAQANQLPQGVLKLLG